MESQTRSKICSTVSVGMFSPDRAERRASRSAGAMSIVLRAGTFYIYREIGAPGYPDLPLAGRIGAAALCDGPQALHADEPLIEQEPATL